MESLNRPKRFGEILDVAFRLSKQHFSKFFLIVLLLIGPLYLLRSLTLLMGGTSFFRETANGSNFLEQTLNSFTMTTDTTLAQGLAGSFIDILTIFFIPVAYAAVLLAVARLKNGEDFAVGEVIKQAFSKYWSLLGGTLLFALIAFAMIFVPLIAVIIVGTISMFADPIAGILIILILGLGIGLTAGYFLMRWSFFLGFTVFEDRVPGLGDSWRLTKGNSWKVFGLFIIFFLIFAAIGLAVDAILVMLLGNSVLYSIMVNLVTLFTSMIFMVGYAVIYFDLNVRHDGADLEHMIDDYENASVQK
ncbi:glycerophosphoryl diester phosphodiesterase membrane domain-containing protein [Lentibacillus sediminis]|uniref:glycerophosphoryl diester phosphodiesterase membrane domain-containing protein n=1 Tax=Lentibacillus sediminis TaxID=1940529 RepID=UPI000C1C236F|nr:glycerophosphoryl diester phosphodiesterase membrane domain-containing protein [Lentibacillus sediminis]